LFISWGASPKLPLSHRRATSFHSLESFSFWWSKSSVTLDDTVVSHLVGELEDSRFVVAIFSTDLEVDPMEVGNNVNCVVPTTEILEEIKFFYWISLFLYSWSHFFFAESNGLSQHVHLCYRSIGRPGNRLLVICAKFNYNN